MTNGTFIAPRSLEAMFWVSRGLKRCEIAGKMGCTVKTVDEQLRRASVDQLGISGRQLWRVLAIGGELKR